MHSLQKRCPQRLMMTPLKRMTHVEHLSIFCVREEGVVSAVSLAHCHTLVPKSRLTDRSSLYFFNSRTSAVPPPDPEEEKEGITANFAALACFSSFSCLLSCSSTFLRAASSVSACAMRWPRRALICVGDMAGVSVSHRRAKYGQGAHLGNLPRVLLVAQ